MDKKTAELEVAKLVQIFKNVDLLIELNKKLKSINLGSERDIIKKQISALDNQIDEEVYKLYKLTPEEIKIIENSLK